MRRIDLANRWIERGAGSLLGLLLGASLVTVVSAHSGSISEKTVHACVKEQNGRTRIVEANEKCKRDESGLDWNVQGPPGVSDLVLKTETSDPYQSGHGLVTESVKCPDGKLALGGGVKVVNASGQDKDGMVMSSYPTGNPPSGWFGSASTQYTTAGGRGTGDRITVYAICAKVESEEDD